LGDSKKADDVSVVKIKDVKLTGTLINDVSSKKKFLLKTEKDIYELIGNTKGLEKEFGKTVVVTGSYVYTLIATEYPLFDVKSYTVIDVPEVTPEPNLQTITGTLTVTKLEVVQEAAVSYGYLLKTQSGPVNLSGKTEGLEKYDGLEVEVTGTYSMLEIYPPIFIVESYKLVSVPAPTPSVTTITIDDNGGYVYAKTGDVVKLVLESNPTTGYIWSYITKPDPDVLLETNYEYIPDNTDEKIVGSGGKEVWTYKTVNNGTALIEMVYSRPWESKVPAKSFTVKVVVEELETISGTLIVTKIDTYEKDSVDYKYLLKTQSGPVSLSGKTEGLEKYNGLEVEVTGTYSMLKIYPPIFIVESYKLVSTPKPTPIPVPIEKPIPSVRPVPTERPIPVPSVKPIPTVRPKPTLKPIPTSIPVPTVRPEPTALPLPKTHTVISEKILSFALPNVKIDDFSGYTTISWTEGTEKAFFSSRINTGSDVYEFELVSVKKSDAERIVGLFNIKKNGELMRKEIKGELYGLVYEEGEYFKFYSEDENCHISAFITKRLDF